MLGEILRKRGVRAVAWFHADHWEPWASGVSDAALKRVESFANQAKSSAFARKMTLFYLAGASYRVRQPLSARAGGSTQEILEIVPRTALQDRQVRECLGDLANQTDNEFQVHFHHEHLVGNDGSWSDLHRQLKTMTDPQQDEERLHFLLKSELAMLRGDTGLPLDKWAFVHGMWALNGSDRSVCQFDNEIEILMQYGCWGDFTFPAGRAHCNPEAIEQPYTCMPYTAAKGYDHPNSKPMPIDVGAGAIRDGRFLIWNSKAKHNVCSLDLYDEANRQRLRNKSRIVFSWLSGCPVIDHTLYIKTHAHSMDAFYFRDGHSIPAGYPDIQAIFELLQLACDDAKVELKTATVDEVFAALREVDGRTGPKPEIAASSAMALSSVLAMRLDTGVDHGSDLQPDYSVTEALALAVLQNWVAEDPARERAAGSYYMTRLAQGQLFIEPELLIAEYSRKHFGPQTKFFELGFGFGELSLLLVLSGFEVTGFESDNGRYAAAMAMVDSLSTRGADLKKLSLVAGRFPGALQLSLTDASNTVLVATNLTSSYVMEKMDYIYRTLRLFDHLILDIAKFGEVRDKKARHTLITDLQQLGFVDVGQIFAAKSTDVRHFRRNQTCDSAVVVPQVQEDVRNSDLDAPVPRRLRTKPSLIFVGREVDAESIFPRLKTVPKSYLPEGLPNIQILTGPFKSQRPPDIPSFEEGKEGKIGRFVFSEFGIHRLESNWGTFKCLLLDPAAGRDRHAIEIFRFVADNTVHSCIDKATILPWADRPQYVRPDLILQKLFLSDQPLALHCDHVSQVTAYLLHLNGYQVREAWLFDPAINSGHFVMEVLLPELGKWAMLDADFGVMVTDRNGVPQGTAEIVSSRARRDNFIVERVVNKHWSSNSFNTAEAYSGQRAWSSLSQAERPTVQGDSYYEMMDRFFVYRREIAYRFEDGFEDNRLDKTEETKPVHSTDMTVPVEKDGHAFPEAVSIRDSYKHELRWTERLSELLVPTLRHQIERRGIKATGAYNFYNVRIQRNDLFQDYEIALARKFLSCDLNIRRIDEIGCGFGQLAFLLGWNGFETVGIEVDKARFRTARTLQEILHLADPELTKNIALLEGEFPVPGAPEPGPNSLLLTTNIVATRTVSQQLDILREMRKYPLVVSDVQRFFDPRTAPEEEAITLALFAQAGFGEPRLFLDLGRGGKYYLFDNSH